MYIYCMKKRILILFAVIASLYINAQTQSELNVGFPTGDTKETIRFGAGYKFNYMFPLTEEFKLGPSWGLMLYLEKDYEYFINTVSYTTEGDPFLVSPIAASGEYTFSERFVVGLDLGVAFYLDTDKGRRGFYYRPTLGYLITEKFVVQVSYSVITQEVTDVSHFGVGLVFSK